VNDGKTIKVALSSENEKTREIVVSKPKRQGRGYRTGRVRGGGKSAAASIGKFHKKKRKEVARLWWGMQLRNMRIREPIHPQQMPQKESTKGKEKPR